MGIEPTEDNPCYPPNRFEACGAHQELKSPLALILYHNWGKDQLKEHLFNGKGWLDLTGV